LRTFISVLCVNYTYKVSLLAILIWHCHATLRQCQEFCEYLQLNQYALNKYPADMASTEVLSIVGDVKKRLEAFDVKQKFIRDDNNKGKM
jgi:hypothetical protein